MIRRPGTSARHVGMSLQHRLMQYRWPVRMAVLFGLGVAAGLGQVPWSLWPLSLMASALAIALVGAVRGIRQIALAGWFFGLGHFALALHWIVQPFLVDVARHGWMAPFALVLMAGGMALFWAAGFGIASALGRGRASPFGIVAGLGLAEIARSLLLTGFPWALPGHIWIGTPISQLAAYVGPHGLTLVTLGLAALVVVTWLRVWLLAPVVGFVLAWFGLAPGVAPPVPPDAPIVRLVQPNAAQDQKFVPGFAEVFVRRLLELTAKGGEDAVEGQRPDLVVWPETAVPWLLEHSAGVLAQTAAAADGVPVVLGVQRREGARYFNSLVVTDEAGGIAAQYDKWHLVPFGEYMPLGEIMGRFGIHGLAASEGGGFSRGPGPGLVSIPGIGQAMPLICYEGIFAEEVNAVPERPRLLLLITNDAWFGGWAGPAQHFGLAQLRAIEQGLPLVRVANTGISGMIDPKGRVTGRMALGVKGAQDVVLPSALRPTVYARFGNWPVFILLLALALVVFRRPVGD